MMPKMETISGEEFERHRLLATHLEAVYTEINKLALKKPTEEITALVSKKINHLITSVREQVQDDEFINAIETVPVERNRIRLDEALITLGELRSALTRQWSSAKYRSYRDTDPLSLHTQIIR